MVRMMEVPIGNSRWLLDGDGFGEVAGLIDVAAAADSDVMGEQLQRGNFQHSASNSGAGGSSMM